MDRVPSTASTAKASSPGRPAGSLQSRAAAAGRLGVTSRTAAATDHYGTPHHTTDHACHGTAANDVVPAASWATGPVDSAGRPFTPST